jgi:hypothetical protein
MAYIKVSAEVVGNIVIGGTPIIANHVESADYISGSMLRGAIAGIWKPAYIGNDDFLDFFCRDNIRFRGLFPIPSGTDGLDFLNHNHFPFKMPLSAFGCKYDAGTGRGGHGFIDGAVINFRNTKACSICKAPLKQCKDMSYYYLKYSDKPEPITTKKEIYIYHGTERTTRRAKDSALYSYTSICNGERFLGWITGNEKDLKNFWCLLKESDKVTNMGSELKCNLRIGRAKKRRGYLECTMKIVTPDPELPETVHPLFYKEACPLLRNDGLLIIVLQTPAILYDKFFQPINTLEPLNIFSDSTFIDKVTRVNGYDFSTVTIIDGWSSVHKLPRTPDIAISAGSTFVFKLNTSSVDNNSDNNVIEELKKIQVKGIGERRNEGYGQILINPPFHRGDGKWQP